MYKLQSFFLFSLPQRIPLSDDHLAVLAEAVLGDLEVERGGSLSYAARDVVVRAVAGAEPAAVVAGLADGDTAEMRADAYSGLVSYACFEVRRVRTGGGGMC